MKTKCESAFRPLTWLGALLLVAVAAGCGSGGGGGSGSGAAASTADIVPGAVCSVAGATIPTITSSNPTNGSQFEAIGPGAGVGKAIAATFSLPMDPATINSAPAGTLLTFTIKETVSGTDVPGTVAMNTGLPAGAVPANLIATFTTTAALTANTSYTATVTKAAKSAGGTAMGCAYVWTFKTVPPAGVTTMDLGILGPFGIASAGGITNAGATKINGDVVLDPDATCNAVAVGAGDDFGLCGGFAPTHNAGDKVTTVLHPDTTTADAVRAVLLSKWNSISPAGTPGATPLGCGTIGDAGDAGAGIGCAGSPTLPPGTYISLTGSSIDVAGTLTLDAAGDPNATWIFQAPSSTVITAVNSTIALTGGAKASNVWWFVGSSATLKAGTTFMGNILASATIAMQNLATSCGRLLSGAEGAGSFTFIANTVSVPGNANAPAVPACQ